MRKLAKQKKIKVYSRKKGREVEVPIIPETIRECQKSGIGSRMLVPPSDNIFV